MCVCWFVSVLILCSSLKIIIISHFGTWLHKLPAAYGERSISGINLVAIVTKIH